MPLSAFAAAELLNWLRGVPPVVVPALWCQLHVEDPSPSCVLNVSATSSRRQVDLGDVSTGVGGNAEVLSWVAAADEVLSWVSLWSASSGGWPLCYGRFGAPMTVRSDEPIVISLNDLLVALL